MSIKESYTPVQMLYSGIFSDERVLQLLHILQSMSEHCFSKLHEVSNEGRPTSTEYAIRFRKGLDSIEYWKTEVKTEQTRVALQQYPELGALYKYAIVCYLKELYKNERSERIPVSIPPLQDFVHAYYVALSKTSYMQKLEFLNVYGLERTHMHMESLRSTLMEFTRHSVYRTPPVDIPYTVASTPAIRGLVSVEKDITPGDSVSQRGDNPYEDEIIRHPSPKPEKRTYFKPLQRSAETSSRYGNKPSSISGNKPSNFQQPPRLMPVSIYDKATENYYKPGNNKNESDDEGDTPNEMNDNDRPDKRQQPSNPLQIEKEESRSNTPSSSQSESSASSSSEKFSHQPQFPPTKSQVSKSKVSSTHEAKSSASSDHTIRVNLPNRPLPDRPPPPLKKSDKPRFF